MPLKHSGTVSRLQDSQSRKTDPISFGPRNPPGPIITMSKDELISPMRSSRKHWEGGLRSWSTSSKSMPRRRNIGAIAAFATISPKLS